MFPLKHNIHLDRVRLDHLHILAAIQDEDGLITAEIEQALVFNEGKMMEAGVSVANLILALESDEADIKAEIDRLKKRKEKVTKIRDLFKSKLTGAMQQYGWKKLESPLLTLSLRNADSVEIIDETEIPAQFFNQPPPVVSREKIKEAIKAGEEVPGAAIITKQHLQIK